MDSLIALVIAMDRPRWTKISDSKFSLVVTDILCVVIYKKQDNWSYRLETGVCWLEPGYVYSDLASAKIEAIKRVREELKRAQKFLDKPIPL